MRKGALSVNVLLIGKSSSGVVCKENNICFALRPERSLQGSLGPFQGSLDPLLWPYDVRKIYWPSVIFYFRKFWWMNVSSNRRSGGRKCHNLLRENSKQRMRSQLMDRVQKFEYRSVSELMHQRSGSSINARVLVHTWRAFCGWCASKNLGDFLTFCGGFFHPKRGASFFGIGVEWWASSRVSTRVLKNRIEYQVIEHSNPCLGHKSWTRDSISMWIGLTNC